MKVLEQIRKPSKLDQKTASESYDALASVIEQLNSEQPEIEIESINGTDVGQSRLCFPAHFGPVKVRVTVF